MNQKIPIVMLLVFCVLLITPSLSEVNAKASPLPIVFSIDVMPCSPNTIKSNESITLTCYVFFGKYPITIKWYWSNANGTTLNLKSTVILESGQYMTPYTFVPPIMENFTGTLFFTYWTTGKDAKRATDEYLGIVYVSYNIRTI